MMKTWKFQSELMLPAKVSPIEEIEKEEKESKEKNEQQDVQTKSA